MLTDLGALQISSINRFLTEIECISDGMLRIYTLVKYNFSSSEKYRVSRTFLPYFAI
jgi:hypothetical protein